MVGKLTGKKKFIFDMALNIASTAIPTFVLQLLILPLLSRNMTDERYGLLVTIIALLNVVPSTMGNALNNVRLIHGEKEKESGDYNALLLLLSVVNLAAVAVFSYLYEKEITLVSLFLTLLVSLMWLAREYYIVAFRIKLNYIHILISNLTLVVGYAVGYCLFKATGHWQYIYLLGLACSLAFIFWKSDLWKEAPKCGEGFRGITVQTVLLTLAGLLTRITTYADKMLVFPFLGGAVVSVYYAATLFGKAVSLVITPVSSVMLSYLSKRRKKDDDLFRLAFLCSAAVCIFAFFLCVAVSRPLLGLLYPQFVDDAMKYIWITTGTTVLVALISIVNPFVLRFFEMKWQLVINSVYVVFYVGLCLSMLGAYGLYGFCTGALAATSVKLIFMLFIYHRCKTNEEN